MSGGKPVVSNSSPLIWLAKIGRLDFLRIIFREVIIPTRVYEETALEAGSADSILICEAIEDGWIKVSQEKLEEATVLANRAGVHLGEAEAILLAQKLGAELIIDEREGSGTAQMFGVRPIGTIAVLMLALAQGHLTSGEFKEHLNRLIALGFWLSVDVYNKVLEEADRWQRRKTQDLGGS
jgi:predicted nucleic acid-binding protein